MAEYLSGTESEQTAEESSQDEFNTIEIEATEGETSVLGHVCALEDRILASRTRTSLLRTKNGFEFTEKNKKKNVSWRRN